MLLRALLLALFLIGALTPESATNWRQATESELKTVIPARAPVEKERIETETRTASGITNGTGKFIAGAVLITAGYSAEGKYSHFLITQVPLKAGDLSLPPGDYVVGFKHEGEGISVSVYEAETGKPLGIIRADRLSRVGRIESFHIFPPSQRGFIAIGRFGFHYEILQSHGD